MLAAYVRQFSEEFSLPLPSPNEKKEYTLTLGELTFTLRDLAPGLSFFARIAPLPEKKREEVLLLAMKGNYLHQGTGGSTIALTDDESFLTLAFAIPYEIKYTEFREHIEVFANYLDFWQSEIKKMVEE